MVRKHVHKFHADDIIKARNGRFRDKSTGHFVPKNWKARIAARYYGAMHKKLSGRWEKVSSTKQYLYGVTQEESDASVRGWLRSMARYYSGKTTEFPTGISP